MVQHRILPDFQSEDINTLQIILQTRDRSYTVQLFLWVTIIMISKPHKEMKMEGNYRLVTFMKVNIIFKNKLLAKEVQ